MGTTQRSPVERIARFEEAGYEYNRYGRWTGELIYRCTGCDVETVRQRDLEVACRC